MWRTWTNMQPTKIAALKANSVHETGVLHEGQPIPGAVLLVLYDHKKCSSLDVRILTKKALNTNYGQIEKYSSTVWNC